MSFRAGAESTQKKSDSAIWSVAGLLVLYELPLWLQKAQWKTWVTSAWRRVIFRFPSFFLETRGSSWQKDYSHGTHHESLSKVFCFPFLNLKAFILTCSLLQSHFAIQPTRQTTRSDTTGVWHEQSKMVLLPHHLQRYVPDVETRADTLSRGRVNTLISRPECLAQTD